ncbi:MAG TPA: CRISPR-associated protein Cas4 [Elusimicrobiales bacterium]|nr:CRISPR-associated protein Cas4 [Elusimicrobiales bacterium]
MYAEEDFLPLSALQHFIFCRRQCALIHIERIWVENQYTAEGRVMHERAHDEGRQILSGVRIERGLVLRSERLGLNGQADVVEFRGDGGDMVPFPIEYKRGRPKADNCDSVQLCAQAISLEEMLGVPVPQGALFYGKTRRRQDVRFDAGLRSETSNIAALLHDFVRAGVTPRPEYSPKCDTCSFFKMCMPKKLSSPRAVKEYLERGLAD